MPPCRRRCRSRSGRGCKRPCVRERLATPIHVNEARLGSDQGQRHAISRSAGWRLVLSWKEIAYEIVVARLDDLHTPNFSGIGHVAGEKNFSVNLGSLSAMATFHDDLVLLAGSFYEHLDLSTDARPVRVARNPALERHELPVAVCGNERLHFALQA